MKLYIYKKLEVFGWDFDCPGPFFLLVVKIKVLVLLYLQFLFEVSVGFLEDFTKKSTYLCKD